MILHKTSALLYHYLRTTTSCLSSFIGTKPVRVCSFLTSNHMSTPTSSPLKYHRNMGHENGGIVKGRRILSVVEDSYDGVTVEITDHIDSLDFVTSLRDSMSHWRQMGKKGVWIKLPIEHANLVGPTVQEGFRYHHAESDYVMLVKWLPNTADTIPANASHRVGIGAFVLNKDSKELLVVKEMNGWARGKDIWKLPTGVVNEGEDICTAAVREIKEETGVDTEFMEILAFRQTHRSLFKKSDLFFVCMLRPLSFNIQQQDVEIAAAKWMKVEEYVEQPYNRQHELFRYVAEICKTKSGSDYAGFSSLPTTTQCSGKLKILYFNFRDFDPSLTGNKSNVI